MNNDSRNEPTRIMKKVWKIGRKNKIKMVGSFFLLALLFVNTTRIGIIFKNMVFQDSESCLDNNSGLNAFCINAPIRSTRFHNTKKIKYFSGKTFDQITILH